MPYDTSIFGSGAVCAFYDLDGDGMTNYFKITMGEGADVLHTGQEYTITLVSRTAYFTLDQQMWLHYTFQTEGNSL